MTARHIPEVLIARDEIVAPPAPQGWQDRTFELPPALHLITATLFLGFVGVLSAAFANPEMVLPFAIFAIFIVAFFAVPALWARMVPEQNNARALSWSEFGETGIVTETGRCSAKSATVLVLLLPFLIFAWSVAVAGIVTFLV